MDPTKASLDTGASTVNRPAKPWYATLEGWKLRLELFAIPFVVLYALVTYLQWRDLRGNFELDERAWIGAEGIVVDPAMLHAGDEPFINISLKNSGKTPAKDLLLTLVFAVVPKGKAPDFSYGRNAITRFGLLPPNGSAATRVRALRGIYGNDSTASVITAPLLETLTSGAAVLYVHGRVLYQDIFNQHHWTTFCYAMSGLREASVKFNYCPEHNDAGNGETQKFTPELPPNVWP